MTSTSNFHSEYRKLNPEQRLAVDTIEGSVMVIAGAGTGKTQTIALRVGKILKETQVNPNNILCLTFTDSAAVNMRQRLISLIGPTAYSVRICTFHAFCNQVISEHPEFFLFSKRQSSAADNVSQVQIIRSLIDQLPLTSPLRNFNSPYFFERDISQALESLKKESVSPERLSKLLGFASDFVDQSQSLAASLSAVRATPKVSEQILKLITGFISDSPVHQLYRTRLKLFINWYQNNQVNLSDLKKLTRNLIESTKNNLAKLTDLLTIYHGYEEQLRQKNLFDYSDMILWVLNAFRQHPDLLSQYQETYQYILVDEFQDTNSSQFEILNLLIQNQPLPNIFVVGDDDQSIFRFQGASVENIYTFYQKHQKHIKVIVLKNNYRSHRLILECSDSVINRNQNRITKYIDNIDKSLIATRTFDPDPINLYIAANPTDEFVSVASRIKQLLDHHVEPAKIAVLYRNNADITDFLPVFDQFGINYLLSDSLNILQTIEIQQLITLLRFIINPENEELLAKILSFNFLGISPARLYRLYRHQTNLIRFFPKFAARIAKTRKEIENLPVSLVFNRLIRRFKFLSYLLRHQRLDVLKQLNVLNDLIKSRLQTVEFYHLSDFVAELDLLMDNDIPLPSQPLLANLEQSIRLFTVHKAKGLEFEHVFLIRVQNGKWDNATQRNFIKLPLGIIKTDISQINTDSSLEEDRRLFYVALTRAKNQIYLSYSQTNESGREILPSVFINEIDPVFIQPVSTTSDTEKQHLLGQYSPSLPRLKSIKLADYLHQYLSTSYRFNVTHLNSYLHCPLCFFFKTILRLPSPKTKSLSFGTAVHGALAYLFDIYRRQNQLISLTDFLAIFKSNLQREHLPASEFNDTLIHGQQILTDYYLNYQAQFNGHCLTEHDFKFFGIHLNAIPITGKIDKIEILNSKEVNVVDFKTGNPDSKYQELKPDGDYFRQLVFYKILCLNAHGFPYRVTEGSIDFIEKSHTGQFKRFNFQITDQHVADLTKLITDTYQKIQNLEFAPDSDCPDRDHLHYLSSKYFSQTG